MNLSFALADPLDYSALLRSLLGADPKNAEFQLALEVFSSCPNYPFVGAAERVRVLKALTESILNSEAVRTELNPDRDPHSIYDDHCRACHKCVFPISSCSGALHWGLRCVPICRASGELLCCESCSAAYHVACVEPPLAGVPEGDWACSVCERSRVRGVSDCLSPAERAGTALRDSCLGRDRSRRKYWFLARRIFVYSVNSSIIRILKQK